MDTPAGRFVLVVLDGLGPEFVSRELTPRLMALAESGGMALAGGLAELVASTGPGHATLLTGASLVEHGVLANRVFGADGAIDRDPRVRVATILKRARDAGRSAALLVSDPDIRITVRGEEADLCFPQPEVIESAGDARTGYIPDVVTTDAIVAAIDAGHELIMVQLQDVDTSAHASGIDSERTRSARRALDESAGRIAEALRRTWERNVFVIVSDHRMEDVASTEPVRLAAALDGVADVIEDGARQPSSVPTPAPSPTACAWHAPVPASMR
jgi:predicted AlkP superfamily pyrophosphatase or phosphodiesterase